MQEEEKRASVPFFIHEATMDKMKFAMENQDRSNKRMLIALVTVCVTLVVTVAGFLLAYRDMNNTWLNFYEDHIEVVAD